MSFRSTVSTVRASLRLNESSRWVRSRARSAAIPICARSLCSSGSSPGLEQRQLAVADDRDEQVVEVVGDAARELADRLELLRLAQPVLERSLLGHVGEDPVPLRLAVLLEQCRLVADPDDGAVLPPHPVLGAEEAGLERELLLAQGRLAVVLVEARAPWRLVRLPLRGRPAEHALDRGADVVPVAGADRGAVDDAREAFDQVSVSLRVQAIVHLVMIVRKRGRT